MDGPKKERHKNEVVEKPSENDAIEKMTNQIGGPPQNHTVTRDATGLSNDEVEKADGEKSKRLEKMHEKGIIVKNENIEAISTKKSKEKKEI
ncbi:hypothetical protein RND71_040602 [Anisodus tanguticus]|uniref:Uncharacterized protein n=1 Tax=Anisodus tanguticus TaxID=243964 RepID=A0AAE1QSX5_9SOLA|nr:hypothetical protein RND71_040602 [Anisodus tanguticus]